MSPFKFNFENCRTSKFYVQISLLPHRKHSLFPFQSKICWHFRVLYKTNNRHRSISIIVQRDATQSSLFIILQVHSTCFGCQPHPSSGVRTTVTTASGNGHIFVQLPPSNMAKLVTLEGGSCSTGGCSYSFVYS